MSSIISTKYFTNWHTWANWFWLHQWIQAILKQLCLQVCNYKFVNTIHNRKARLKKFMLHLSQLNQLQIRETEKQIEFVQLGKQWKSKKQKTAPKHEIVGSNPAGCSAFSPLRLISSDFLVGTLMKEQLNWFSLKNKLGHAAWGKAT